MNKSFAETLCRLRIKKNLSQQQLARQLYVDRSTVTNWENGRRVPNIDMVLRLAECLDVDVSVLLVSAETDSSKPIVMIVDDEPIILNGELSILQEIVPHAEVIGFTEPDNAVKYAKNNKVALAFLDIEMGKTNGLQMCKELLEINPHTNVIYLTAYMNYSYDAWTTGACGFILKPLLAEDIRRQLAFLRYPVRGLEL